MSEYKKHDSMRGWFGYELYQKMFTDKDIFLLLGDLGFAMFDKHRESFPDRVINCGASEQLMLGAAVGLAIEHKKVFTYTITSFYLRAAETIALYLKGENIPVKLIGAGKDGDYAHDGPSHHGGIAQAYLGMLGIDSLYPQTKEEIPDMLNQVLRNNTPQFICLRR